MFVKCCGGRIVGLTFNTLIVDISVALKAINFYQSGQFEEAISELQSVLDYEPKNWDARLMLAACYYKTKQWSAAHRVFQFIEAQSNNAGIKQKAAEGIRVCDGKMKNWHGSASTVPAEFGCFVERWNIEPKQEMSWL